MSSRCIFHKWAAQDDCQIEGYSRVWSVIFYRCLRCGAEKVRLMRGSVQIEDLS